MEITIKENQMYFNMLCFINVLKRNNAANFSTFYILRVELGSNTQRYHQDHITRRQTPCGTVLE